jgi:hypothetical protein
LKFSFNIVINTCRSNIIGSKFPDLGIRVGWPSYGQHVHRFVSDQKYLSKKWYPTPIFPSYSKLRFTVKQSLNLSIYREKEKTSRKIENLIWIFFMFLNQNLSSKNNILWFNSVTFIFKSYINTTFNRVKVSLNIWKIKSKSLYLRIILPQSISTIMKSYTVQEINEVLNGVLLGTTSKWLQHLNNLGSRVILI